MFLISSQTQGGEGEGGAATSPAPRGVHGRAPPGDMPLPPVSLTSNATSAASHSRSGSGLSPEEPRSRSGVQRPGFAGGCCSWQPSGGRSRRLVPAARSPLRAHDLMAAEGSVRRISRATSGPRPLSVPQTDTGRWTHTSRRRRDLSRFLQKPKERERAGERARARPLGGLSPPAAPPARAPAAPGPASGALSFHVSFGICSVHKDFFLVFSTYLTLLLHTCFG